jgi:hypothetical protein
MVQSPSNRVVRLFTRILEVCCKSDRFNIAQKRIVENFRRELPVLEAKLKDARKGNV